MGKIKIILCSLFLLSFFILSFLNPSSTSAQLDSHCTKIGDECCGPLNDLYCDSGLFCNEETGLCEGEPDAHCGLDGELCCDPFEKGYECANSMSTCVEGRCQPPQGPEIPPDSEIPIVVGPEECKGSTPDNPILKTAVGCIHTKPSGFIKDLFGIALSLAGGIAFLLMTWGAFLFITSQGNPDQLQKAKETIVSAIGGLLFIIFAVFLLRLIGVDILKIPGFEK